MSQKVIPLRGYSLEPIFYVYLHKRPTDNSVFYVGKGKENRAWTNKSRSPHWQHVVDKHGGFLVEIIKENLTEQEAFELEALTVRGIGIENLTNKTLGGISTTGMQHSEETKKLQSEIAKKRIEDNPEKLNILNDRLAVLHDLQKNDPEYKKIMSEKMKAYYASLSSEEKDQTNKKKNLWQQDPDKYEKWVKKMKSISTTDEARERMSKQSKGWWESLSEEERQAKAAKSRETLLRPDIREKLSEFRCKKIVVNKKIIFNSIKEFLISANIKTEETGNQGVLAHPRKIASEFGFNFYIYKGYYLQDYDPSIHAGLQVWESGLSIPKPLNFDTLPRSKAIVSDSGKVFLSMKEAALFCNGKTWEATAGFITKRMKQGKPAMGYFWSVATDQQIAEEVERRLLEQEET